MPIKPENAAKYPPDWNAVRDRILVRADYRCEFERADGSRCNAHNGDLIGRSFEDREQWWPFETALNYMETTLWYPVKVVLTIAHLNHDPTDCRDENLKAGCQLHHLRYDSEHHQETAAATRRLKKSNGELFPDLTPAPVETDTARRPERTCDAND
jgi:hypothetical protein